MMTQIFVKRLVLIEYRSLLIERVLTEIKRMAGTIATVASEPYVGKLSERVPAERSDNGLLGHSNGEPGDDRGHMICVRRNDNVGHYKLCYENDSRWVSEDSVTDYFKENPLYWHLINIHEYVNENEANYCNENYRSIFFIKTLTSDIREYIDNLLLHVNVSHSIIMIDKWEERYRLVSENESDVIKFTTLSGCLSESTMIVGNTSKYINPHVAKTIIFYQTDLCHDIHRLITMHLINLLAPL
jgi:hypothetical protein